MTTRIYSAELTQERKVTVRAFTEKTAAIRWARERVADESVSAITVWLLSASRLPRDAICIATEGKPWYDERRVVAIIARKGARVMR
jgi:hypothetical protein